MEPKTALNNTQRKMLDTIFIERIDKKVRAFNSRRSGERDKLVKSELEAAKKAKEVKAYEKLYKEMKVVQESLRKKGIKVEVNYDGVVKVNLGDRYNDSKPFKLESFDLETASLEEKINEARTEVRARIYGMDTSYEQVDKELLDYFSFLDK